MFRVDRVKCKEKHSSPACLHATWAVVNTADNREVARGHDLGALNQLANAANVGLEYIERETRKAIFGAIDDDSQRG